MRRKVFMTGLGLGVLLFLGCTDLKPLAESNNPYYIPVNPDSVHRIQVRKIVNKTPEKDADKLYRESLVLALARKDYRVVLDGGPFDIALEITLTRFYSSPVDEYDARSTMNPVTAIGDALIQNPTGEVVVDVRVLDQKGKAIWTGSIASEKEVSPGGKNTEWQALQNATEATVQELIRRLGKRQGGED